METAYLESSTPDGLRIKMNDFFSGFGGTVEFVNVVFCGTWACYITYTP